MRTTKGISSFFAKKSSIVHHPPFAPPLSLLYIASSLEKEDHKVELIDVTCEKDAEGRIHQALQSIDAVVITVLTDDKEGSASLAQFIRDNRPDIPIIIHGLHCTIHPVRALQDVPSANICIEGEGEHIINEIIEAIDGKKLLSQIPGVYYRKNNQIKAGKISRKIKELDILPFPARHLVKEYNYGMMNGIHFCRPRFTSILTSRGCPFGCRFCANQLKNGPYRQRSPKNVLHEFRQIQDDYNSVMIADDNFLADTQRAHKIMDGLINTNSELELLITGVRVDSANRELYRKMAKAGVKFISFGIESGNQDVLDYYHKRITLSHIKKAVDLAREMNFITWGNFILGAPFETKKHFKNTVKFSLSLSLDMAFYRQLTYQRGSKLWEEAVTNGLIEEDSYYCSAGSGKTATNLNTDELSDYCRWAFKRFYYRPTYLLKEFIRCVKRKDFTILRLMYSMI